MRITKKMVRGLLEALDEIVEEIRQEEKEKYPYAEWERKREIVKERLRKLPEYVREALAMIIEELLELFEPLFGLKVSYKTDLS